MIRIISIFNWQYNLLCPIISILYVYTFITNIWSWYMCWIFKLFYELVVIIIIISWGIYNTILIICNLDNFWYCQRFRLVRWSLDDINSIYDNSSFWKRNSIMIYIIHIYNICNVHCLNHVLRFVTWRYHNFGRALLCVRWWWWWMLAIIAKERSIIDMFDSNYTWCLS